VAQYCTLLTFGAALVIEAKLTRGLDPFALGAALVATNLVVASFIAFVCVDRYRRERRERKAEKNSQAQVVERAVDFLPNKFDTTLGQPHGHFYFPRF
jgi:hypothetical protein